MQRLRTVIMIIMMITKLSPMIFFKCKIMQTERGVHNQKKWEVGRTGTVIT